MSGHERWLLRLVNCGVIAVALFAAIRVGTGARSLVSLAESWWQVPALTVPMVSVGSIVSLDGVDWTKSSNTVLVVTSRSCHFCDESVPFYQELGRKSKSKSLRLIVVSADPLPDTRQWLAESNLPDVEALHVDSIADLGLHSTPSLLIVDASGKAVAGWVGILTDDDIQLVTRYLSDKPGPNLPKSHLHRIHQVTSSEIPTLPRSGILVDLRPQSTYKQKFSQMHSINIPWDEFRTRAANELSPDMQVTIDCTSVEPETVCRAAGLTLLRLGHAEVTLLVRSINPGTKVGAPPVK